LRWAKDVFVLKEGWLESRGRMSDNLEAYSKRMMSLAIDEIVLG